MSDDGRLIAEVLAPEEPVSVDDLLVEMVALDRRNADNIRALSEIVGIQQKILDSLIQQNAPAKPGLIARLLGWSR